MKPAFLVEFLTPKKYRLSGVWCGPKRAQYVVIMLHGLGGSMLSSVSQTLAEELPDAQTAVLTFNNRGHDVVSKLLQDAPHTKKGYKRTMAGAAKEIFTDSIDDIDGAVLFAKKAGAKKIILAGHSTGCQKAVYWASKRRSGVQAIVLLAPVSDFAAMRKEVGAAKMKRALRVARQLVKGRRPHALLPLSAWPEIVDAQRFVSLYSGESAEELFPYWDAKCVPRSLRSITIPILAVLAGEDEYWDRPVEDVAEWFLAHIYTGEAVVFPGAIHSFRGKARAVAGTIREFMKSSGI